MAKEMNTLSKQELGFLAEVAAELVSRGISEPTPEQIADAMESRIARQWEICAKLCPQSIYGPSADAKEFMSGLSAMVYRQVTEAK